MTVYKFVLMIVLVAFLVWLETSVAFGACLMSYCKKDQTRTRTYITNTHRQKVGDLYSVPGQRTQIRNTHRQIIGYIESDGSITNLHRQKIGEINER